METVCVSDSAPDEYFCPISKRLMLDPVQVSSGMTFDRHCIEEWLRSGNHTCPLTRQPVEVTSICSNETLRTEILCWLHQQGGQVEQLELSTAPVEVLSGHFLIPAVFQRSVPRPSLVELTKLLTQLSTTEAQHQVLCSINQLLLTNRYSADAIVGMGIIPLLLQILVTAPSQNCLIAAECLSLLSVEHELQANLIKIVCQLLPWIGSTYKEAGLAASVSKLVDKLALRDKQGCAISAWALRIFSVDTAARSCMTKSTMVERLVKLLSASSHSSSMIAAAYVLRSISLSRVGLTLINKCGAIPPLLTMLQLSSEDCRIAACSALSNVMRAAVRCSGTRMTSIASTAAMMRSCLELLASVNQHAQRSACILLASLISDTTTALEVAQPDCLLLLLHLLRTNEATVFEPACKLSAQFVRHSDDALKQVLCKAGFVSALAAHLGTELKPPTGRCLALTLNKLVCRDTAPFFLEVKPFSQVLSALSSKPEDVSYLLARPLLNICRCTVLSSEHLGMMSSCTIHALMRLLTSDSLQYQHIAAAGLKHVLTHPSNADSFVRLGGIHVLLDVVECYSKDTSANEANMGIFFCTDEEKIALEQELCDDATEALRVLQQLDPAYKQRIQSACRAFRKLSSTLG